MNSYIRLNDGLNKYKLIPANSDIYELIESNDKDYYTSLYEYNDTHYKQWQTNHSVAGIKDTTTTRLVFDFDNSTDISLAQKDTVTLINRLIEKNIPKDNIQITFSGNKGFGVEVKTTDRFTPEEFKMITSSLAGDLKTFDRVVSDPNRIVRLLGTKHPKSGLYKIPLSFNDIHNLAVNDIKALATNLDNVDMSLMNNWKPVILSKEIKELKVIKEEKDPTTNAVLDINLKKKPRFLDMPRWYLQNGYFGSGERHSAFLCLAATYKNLGFEREHTYRLLKGIAEIQAERNNVDRYSDKEVFIIVKSVYSDTWEGGQFSLKDENGWLYQYAKKYNIKVEDINEKPMVMCELGGDNFARYAKSFYETRIYTGLKDLDEAFPICAGSNIAIVGAASSGKTAMSLNILRETNKQNAVSVFASLDMSKSRLYEKLLYSVTKGSKSRDDIYKDYINGKGKYYDDMVKDAYPNTFIFGKSSPTIDEVRRYIEMVQDHTGKPVRLLLVDYFERLNSEKSDDTAASKDVAGGIQDLIADFPELTPITLFQPNKFSLGGGPDKPILSYTAIKGSSFVYQSARQILSLWRPFFTPDLIEYDKFMEMAILKNDLGELGKFVYSWEGKTGKIRPMNDIEEEDYRVFMKEKQQLESKNIKQDDF